MEAWVQIPLLTIVLHRKQLTWLFCVIVTKAVTVHLRHKLVTWRCTRYSIGSPHMDMTNSGYLERHVPIQYMGKWEARAHIWGIMGMWKECAHVWESALTQTETKAWHQWLNVHLRSLADTFWHETSSAELVCRTGSVTSRPDFNQRTQKSPLQRRMEGEESLFVLSVSRAV